MDIVIVMSNNQNVSDAILIDMLIFIVSTYQ